MKNLTAPLISSKIVLGLLFVILTFTNGLSNTAYCQTITDPRPNRGSLKVEIFGKGIYRVYAQDFSSAGINTSNINPDTFQMFHRDKDIPIIVSSADAISNKLIATLTKSLSVTMPNNSSYIRLRNRCQRTGRPRGYLSKFRLSRITFREMASAGFIPGITKSSW